MDRAPGLSVRLKLTLSYAGFLMLAGALLLAVGYLSLSRGVHPGVIFMVRSHADLLRDFAPIAAVVMTFLLVFGLLGGWLLAGRMLAPLTPHHRCHTRGGKRIALPPNRVGRTRRRVPRARRQLRHHARAARNARGRTAEARRRTAEIRSQRLPRAAHPARSRADTPRCRPQRSKSRQRRARRPAPLHQHPSDRPHGSTAPAEPRRPTILHPRPRRPVARRRKKPPRRSSSSLKNAASRSRPPARSPPPSAHLRSCCRWLRTSCTTRSSTTCPSKAPCGSRPAPRPRAWFSQSRTQATSSRRNWFPRLTSRFNAAADAYAPTTQGSASAWQSSRASPRHTTEPSPWPPGLPVGSASRVQLPAATPHRRGIGEPADGLATGLRAPFPQGRPGHLEEDIDNRLDGA